MDWWWMGNIDWLLGSEEIERITGKKNYFMGDAFKKSSDHLWIFYDYYYYYFFFS